MHTPRLAFIIFLAALTSIGCMRQEEDKEPPFWLTQTTESASRRYPVKLMPADSEDSSADDGNTDEDEDTEGTEAESRTPYILQRRGSTLLLSNHRGQRMGKASARRADARVVLRNPQGDIVARTVLTNQGLEVHRIEDGNLDEPGELMSALSIPEDKKRFVLSVQGGELREFIRDGDQIKTRPLNVPNAPVSVVSLSEEGTHFVFDRSSALGDLTIEKRSELSELGFAVLMAEELDPISRLGLTAHLDILNEELDPDS